MVTLYISEFVMIGVAVALLCALPIILIRSFKAEIKEIKASYYMKGYKAGLYQNVINMSSSEKAD